MKVGDKVVTRFGTGFVEYINEEMYIGVRLDGHEGVTGFMIDHVWICND